MGHPATAPTFAAPPPGPGTLLTTLLVLPCHGTYAAPRHHRAIPPPSTSLCPYTAGAMPCHATPRRAMPCHVTSSCLPLQPIDCWSTWPRRRHQVNVRTQLVRSTSLAYSLTISRTRHRRRRRSTGIYNLPHHPPRPTTVNRLSTPPANLSLAVMYYVLRPRSRSMYTDHPLYRDPHSPRSLPIMQVAQSPPCAARHFSSPPQAITTSSLPVSSPLPPPPPTSPPATNCTNVTYATYTTYATTVTTLGPPPPLALLPLSSNMVTIMITAKLNPPTHMQHGSERRTSDPTVRHHHQRTQSGFSFQVEMECCMCAYMYATGLPAPRTLLLVASF